VGSKFLDDLLDDVNLSSLVSERRFTWLFIESGHVTSFLFPRANFSWLGSSQRDRFPKETLNRCHRLFSISSFYSSNRFIRPIN